ncbi:MAG: hypothetical protein JJU45_15565 [Acidimicrobiia bacterium]|nr:hypothetical protein [Acidimicrobiia bacterium]
MPLPDIPPPRKRVRVDSRTGAIRRTDLRDSDDGRATAPPGDGARDTAAAPTIGTGNAPRTVEPSPPDTADNDPAPAEYRQQRPRPHDAAEPPDRSAAPAQRSRRSSRQSDRAASKRKKAVRVAGVASLVGAIVLLMVAAGVVVVTSIEDNDDWSAPGVSTTTTLPTLDAAARLAERSQALDPAPNPGVGSGTDVLVVLGGGDADALDAGKRHWLGLAVGMDAAAGGATGGCGLVGSDEQGTDCATVVDDWATLVGEAAATVVVVVSSHLDLGEFAHPATGALGSLDDVNHQLALGFRFDEVVDRLVASGAGVIAVTTLSVPPDADPALVARAGAYNALVQQLADRRPEVHVADIDGWVAGPGSELVLRDEDGSLTAEAGRRLWLEVVGPQLDAGRAAAPQQ